MWWDSLRYVRKREKREGGWPAAGSHGLDHSLCTWDAHCTHWTTMAPYVDTKFTMFWRYQTLDREVRLRSFYHWLLRNNSLVKMVNVHYSTIIGKKINLRILWLEKQISLAAYNSISKQTKKTFDALSKPREDSTGTFDILPIVRMNKQKS